MQGSTMVIFGYWLYKIRSRTVVDVTKSADISTHKSIANTSHLDSIVLPPKKSSWYPKLLNILLASYDYPKSKFDVRPTIGS